MRNIRTDMAMESCFGPGGEVLPGVDVNQWEEGGVEITEVVIRDPDTAAKMGKKTGIYLTLETGAILSREPDARIACANLLGEEIARALARENENGEGPVLVVGLGNRDITPDSLGPAVVDRTLVTRHMIREAPEEAKGLAEVCAVAPGVLGVTGIETAEMVVSLCRSVKPRAVICIDSLSARAAARIGSSIQLSDAGIAPGSGVGNHRRALDRESLGCPVIAVGMPTVIYAATLARDALEYLDPEAEDEAGLDAAERELLKCDLGEMIVTPRGIDNLIGDAATVIASGINRALQPGLSDGEMREMMGD